MADATLTQPTSGLGSTAMTNQLLGKQAFDEATGAPTVVTNANVVEKGIPQATNSLAKANSGTLNNSGAQQQNGVVGKFDASGNFTPGRFDALGNFTPTDNSSSGGVATPNQGSSMNDVMDYVYGTSSEADKNANLKSSVEATPEYQLIAGLKTSNDASYNQLVKSIQEQYAGKFQTLATAQNSTTAGINQSLEQSGANRYAPVSASGIISAKQTADITELNNLQHEEDSLLAQANSAKSANDYKTVQDTLALYDKKRQEKLDQAQKIYDNLQEEKKTDKANLNTAQSDALKTASANGAPQAVIDAIKASNTPSDVYASLGNYGAGSNNDVIDLGTSTAPHKVLVNKTTGKIIKDFGGGDSSGSSTPTKTSDDATYGNFLVGRTQDQATAFNKMGDIEKSNVQSLINGDTDLATLFPSRSAAGSADRQKYLDLAKKVDPNYSPAVGTARMNFIKKWNDPNGKTYMIRTGINTALQHLDRIAELTKGLANNGDFQKANSISNWITSNVNSPKLSDPNDPNSPTVAEVVAQYKDTVTLLATEIAKAYKGGVPDQTEVQAQIDSINANQPKNVLNAIINNKVGLMTGLLTAQAEEYKKTMGKYPDEALVDKEVFDNLKATGVNTDKIEKNLQKVSAGNDSTGDKIKTALQTINPNTNKPYTNEDIIHQLMKDPDLAPKITEALKDPEQNIDTIIEYLKSQ